MRGRGCAVGTRRTPRDLYPTPSSVPNSDSTTPTIPTSPTPATPSPLPSPCLGVVRRGGACGRVPVQRVGRATRLGGVRGAVGGGAERHVAADRRCRQPGLRGCGGRGDGSGAGWCVCGVVPVAYAWVVVQWERTAHSPLLPSPSPSPRPAPHRQQPVDVVHVHGLEHVLAVALAEARHDALGPVPVRSALLLEPGGVLRPHHIARVPRLPREVPRGEGLDSGRRHLDGGVGLRRGEAGGALRAAVAMDDLVDHANRIRGQDAGGEPAQARAHAHVGTKRPRNRHTAPHLVRERGAGGRHMGQASRDRARGRTPRARAGGDNAFWITIYGDGAENGKGDQAERSGTGECPGHCAEVAARRGRIRASRRPLPAATSERGEEGRAAAHACRHANRYRPEQSPGRPAPARVYTRAAPGQARSYEIPDTRRPRRRARRGPWAPRPVGPLPPLKLRGRESVCVAR